jgi:Cu(I)/Ag(I) efflux system membrane protein CusA/SilA
MISRIIEFSARNPFLVILLVIAIVGGGIWAVYNTPLDAIPDLSDVQVIVYTQWEDRSPDIIEDQVTYPVVTQLLSAPKVKAVRANSFLGFSLVYVIFDDGTDLYWARRARWLKIRQQREGAEVGDSRVNELPALATAKMA